MPIRAHWVNYRGPGHSRRHDQQDQLGRMSSSRYLQLTHKAVRFPQARATSYDKFNKYPRLPQRSKNFGNARIPRNTIVLTANSRANNSCLITLMDHTLLSTHKSDYVQRNWHNVHINALPTVATTLPQIWIHLSTSTCPSRMAILRLWLVLPAATLAL